MAQLSFTLKENIPSIVQGLRQQFRTGLTKDLTFRKQQLQNLHRMLIENKQELTDAVWKDLHKHKLEADTGEIAPIVDECLYMIKNLDRLAKPEHTVKRFRMNSQDKTYIRKEPKGVALVIGAWNYPIHLLFMPVVGAIAAGNCVLIKPSEVSAHTAELVSRLVPEYLDQRAYALVNGGVEETTVVLEQKFDHIFYTGNGVVGRIVMAAASKHLTPVTLELGGKSPAIVAPDANLHATANRLMWGKFFNNGQTCVAPDYILVTEKNAAALISAFQKSLANFYTENPQKSSSYGRIVNHRQFDRLKGIIDSLDPSAIIIGGTTDRDDLYISPTVVSPVDANDTRLMENEIFGIFVDDHYFLMSKLWDTGPILPIVTVKDMEEAVDIINAKDSPLAMYIFTESKAIYNNILDKTNSGGVLVNDTLMQILEMSLPFGGVGASGMGSYHGDKSFYTFTHERSTMVKSSGMEGAMNVRYPPYNDDKHTLMAAMVYGLPAAAGAKVKEFMTVCAASWNLMFAQDREQSKL
ncbi:Aldehyde dehydrogenase [Apophysomyces sp. BC1034]|nr:Aldehyde dehydrogenase [Apophysomyces sp. BC1015]KAG0182070.1 Aldehyde dehydrogenase [Apophysomyces sp. BC1021]KAG0192754.1 Aldehyde dehydrogenase [Apophysomyces sp. BC1034]